MLERLREIAGKTLDRTAYHEDFARERARLTGVIWKLERAQYFREPHDPSWRALMSGAWAKAVRVFEEERPAIRTEARDNARRGVNIRRIRVVEHPISAYVQWEMHSFRVLAEEGFELHVVEASLLRDLERHGPVPEVVVLGDQVLYEVRYDDQWTPCGARRIDDTMVIRQARTEMAALYERGGPVLEFFDREIAPLPAPVV